MEVYEAKYDYCDECGDSLLSFKRGDKFIVTYKDEGGWWAAQNLSNNEIGYIPSSFVEFVAVVDPLTLNQMDMTAKQQKIKMDALCELTAKISQNPNPGRYHPQYPKEDYLDESTSPTTPEFKRKTTPLSTSREQEELRRDLKFSQQRGIQLGRPELVKTWEKFEQKKSVKAEKEKVPDSELESRFRSISQKHEDLEKQKEVEDSKPEFLKVSLKKSTRVVEATS